MACGQAVGLPLQKKSIHASERERPDVVQARGQWEDDTAQVDPRRLIFLDESGAKTNMTRGYGWGMGGDRVVDTTPNGHWNTTTMLAAIRVDGVIPEACASFRGATNGEVFLFYV